MLANFNKDGGGHSAEVAAYLLLTQQSPGLILGVPKNFSLDVAEIY